MAENHEVSKGWLRGTLREGDAASRRFPINQGGKLRPIDDYSQSQINSSITLVEQATVDGPDVIYATALFLMRCLKTNGRSTRLLGRALDLTSAYRQIPIGDDSLRFAYLSVYCPKSQRAELFQQLALPFGSRAAVNAFIRRARFLQWIAARCLVLPLTCYFDDFVAFSPPELTANSQSSMMLMLDVLGWAFDRVGPKSDDFSSMVTALGVIFNLETTPIGTLSVTNTERRIAEVVASIDELLDRKILSKKEALRLRGRLAFCDAFVFGRLGKVALQSITQHAYRVPFFAEVDEITADALRLLRQRVSSGDPRVLNSNLLQTVYLFTDASFEPGTGAGLGGVLLNGTGEVVSWYSISLDLKQLSVFLTDGREQIIGELETLAVALAIIIWNGKLCSMRVMIYIDNEGAKYALIRGYSRSKPITSICALTATYLDMHCIIPWYSRVPSQSNIEDWPSRQVQHPFLLESHQEDMELVRKAFDPCSNFTTEAWVGAVAKAGGYFLPTASEKRALNLISEFSGYFFLYRYIKGYILQVFFIIKHGSFVNFFWDLLRFFLYEEISCVSAC